MYRIAASFLACAVLLPGCAGKDAGPPLHLVSGTVTLDGAAVPKGQVAFLPAEGDGRPDAGPIEDGRFEFRTTAGKKKVEITASRETGKTGPYGEAVSEQYIPEKYNTKSGLSAEVKESGENRFEFPLLTK